MAQASFLARKMHCSDPPIARIFSDGQRNVHGEGDAASLRLSFPLYLPDAISQPSVLLGADRQRSKENSPYLFDRRGL